MVHITNSLQGLLSKRMLEKGERTIRVGDEYKRHVEAVGTLKLILKSGFIMYLKDTLYVPSITQNLISVPKLLLHDYEFMFGYYGLKVYFNSRLVGTGSLNNNLIKLQLDSNFEKSLLSMDVNVISNGTRKHLDEESSSRLWHKRLGHISKDRMQRLIKEEILHHLDFLDFNQCVECIKGKFVKTIKKGSTRSRHLLEIIHTDICGPFINDIAEVENQLNRKIKIENGYVNKFTMPYTPQQNGVAERRNHTLTDMVRSMICNSILPKFLWTEALKTTTHILNRVPSKFVPKMPFELWTGRAPSLRHFKIWGCPAEAKNFNPQTKKLDSRTISCYLMDTQNDLKGVGSISLIIPLELSKQGMLNFLKMVKSVGVLKEALT
ncbi:putative RNA-directed DNA polymerase [Tanacetum coccineum]